MTSYKIRKILSHYEKFVFVHVITSLTILIVIKKSDVVSNKSNFLHYLFNLFLSMHISKIIFQIPYFNILVSAQKSAMAPIAYSLKPKNFILYAIFSPVYFSVLFFSICPNKDAIVGRLKMWSKTRKTQVKFWLYHLLPSTGLRA